MVLLSYILRDIIQANQVPYQVEKLHGDDKNNDLYATGFTEGTGRACPSGGEIPQ
jgi:hypothetical protein